MYPFALSLCLYLNFKCLSAIYLWRCKHPGLGNAVQYLSVRNDQQWIIISGRIRCRRSWQGRRGLNTNIGIVKGEIYYPYMHIRIAFWYVCRKENISFDVLPITSFARFKCLTLLYWAQTATRINARKTESAIEWPMGLLLDKYLRCWRACRKT